MPEVTVIIPTHQRRHLVGRMLGCALAQHDVALEVVVIDDGSTDDTFALLSAHPDPRVRAVRHEQPWGLPATRNHGVALARAPWVAFADDDDLWSPDKLAAQLAAARATPGAGWVCAGSVEVDEGLQPLGWEPVPRPGKDAQLLARNVIPGGGSGVLARTELVRRAGGFDTRLRLAEDRDMWIRLWLASPLARIDRPLVAHMVHTATLSQRGDGRLEAFERIAEKYAAARAQHDVDLDPQVLSSYADAVVRGGRRADGIRLYLQAGWRFRRPRLLAKAAIAALAPAMLRRRWASVARQWAASLPPAWERELDAWLAPHRDALAGGPARGSRVP